MVNKNNCIHAEVDSSFLPIHMNSINSVHSVPFGVTKQRHLVSNQYLIPYILVDQNQVIRLAVLKMDILLAHLPEGSPVCQDPQEALHYTWMDVSCP